MRPRPLANANLFLPIVCQERTAVMCYCINLMCEFTQACTLLVMEQRAMRTTPLQFVEPLQTGPTCPMGRAWERTQQLVLVWW
jgi:hypothetical protein